MDFIYLCEIEQKNLCNYLKWGREEVERVEMMGAK
jgi:hypothetical protein